MLNFTIRSICTYFISYLVGSIPTGYWFARWFFHVDVTKHGSGNIGATNVARVLGSKKYFVFIFLFDMLKAAGTLYGLMYISPLTQPHLSATALALMLGNTCSLFLRFRGGKGVSTYIGCLLILSPQSTAVFLIAWIPTAFIMKQNDVASLTATAITVLYVIYTYGSHSSISTFVLGATLLIVFKHRSNITQLIAQKK